MFMKKPNHRTFEYIPRFYKPESDEKERKKRKLGFTAHRKIPRSKQSPILWILLILIVIYTYLKLSNTI